MKKIKLLKVNTMENGTIRLQSQLMVGTDNVDFIMENDTLKCWGNGEKGFNFYKYKKPYEIVADKKNMAMQQL